jgi:putative ABC transport system permease protein
VTRPWWRGGIGVDADGRRGLLLQSFWKLQRVDPGVDARGVLAVGIRLPASYDSTVKQAAFFEALRERARAAGVTDAALGIVPPFGGVGYTSDFHVAGRPLNDYGSEVGRDYVTPEYFRTLRVPLRAGRSFTSADRSGAVPVVIINEAMARKHFRGQDPVGQRITFDRVPDSTSVWRTIVGIVGDVRQQGLAIEPQIEAFEPAAQQVNSYMTLLVRTGGDAAALAPAIRRVVADLDPTLALAQVQLLERLQARSIAGRRFIMSLLVVFAVTGFALAVVGIYGVMAQLGRRRTQEMGIRIALGARAAHVQWLVVRHGMKLVTGGLVVGLLGATGATRAMRALLFEVTPGDPVTFVTVPALLALTALAASWLPAARASRADPAAAARRVKVARRSPRSSRSRTRGLYSDSSRP